MTDNLLNLHKRLLQYVHSLHSKKRGNFEPYGVHDNSRKARFPVRFLRYHNVTDSRSQGLCDELRSSMVNLGMAVAGRLLMTCDIKCAM